MMKFKLGQVTVTRGVADRMNAETAFDYFVRVSLGRYVQCDWGDTCEEDKKTSDKAVKNGERIMAVYNYKDRADDQIWIITEWDRSVTTVLFPDEY